jgi:membrane fusion protein, adhesin transport system
VQVMQSLDGGIVSEILVKEGQQVKTGQLLLKVDPTRFVSSLRENRAQYIALLAKAARLTAVANGKPFIPPPELIKEAPDLVEQERSAYENKRMELDATVGVATQQLSQRRNELTELIAKREQAAQSYSLTARELEVTRPLAKTGAVSEVELLRLERDVARYRGERDASSAQIPRIQGAISEAQRKIEEVELTMRNQARSELSDTNAKLSALSAGSEGLADRVKQAEIRAPMNGTVKQLFANTVGGVVQPGKEIIEIVPSDDALMLEARIQPKDIGFLRPGQPALVKFTAYDFSIYGGLEATLEQIGADTITDEKGNAFYIVRVRTKRSTIGDAAMPIIPGMVAEVDILTGKKSLLSYMMKPVLRAKATALTER